MIFAAHALTYSAIVFATTTTQNVAVGGISPQSVGRSLVPHDALADFMTSSSVLMKDSKYPSFPFQPGIDKSALGNVERSVGQQVPPRSESDTKAWAGISSSQNIPNQPSVKISKADSAKGNIVAYQALSTIPTNGLSGIGNGVPLCNNVPLNLKVVLW